MDCSPPGYSVHGVRKESDMTEQLSTKGTFYPPFGTDPPLAPRAPLLMRSNPSAFFSFLISFLKIHSQFLHLYSKPFQLQFLG